jgi:hypothetical protein
MNAGETFEGRFARLEEDVKRLLRIVIEGNGHDPLTVRMTRVEDALQSQTAILRWILGLVTGTATIVLGAFVVWLGKKMLGV